MLITGLFEMRGVRLIAAVATTLTAMAVSLLLAPGVAHAWEVNLSVKGAGKITEVTDAGLIAQDCTGGMESLNTTPTGVIGDSCSPGSPTGTYGHGWIVEYRAEAKPGFQFVQWVNHKGNEPNTYNPVLCDGWNGPDGNNDSANPTYKGQNCRFQIFQNLQVQAVFADTTAPQTPTVGGPSQPVNQSASFSFFKDFSDNTFKQFECRIQNVNSFQACGTGSSAHLVNVGGLADGFYTFQVQARDFSNNVSGIGSASFIVDKTAPQTTITSGPAHNSTTQDRNATFNFESTETGTFECNLMGPGLTNSSFAPCGSFVSSTTGTRSFSNLKDGTYTFKVRSRDQAGNVSAVSAPGSQRTWTINNKPTVASTMPANKATDVLRNTSIRADFSEEMSSTSLKNADNTSSTFKLQMYVKKTKKWKTIPATITLSLEGGKTVATLDPYGATEGTSTEQPLAANKKFRGLITTGAKDLDSNPLATKFVWIFNTGSVVGG